MSQYAYYAADWALGAGPPAGWTEHPASAGFNSIQVVDRVIGGVSRRVLEVSTTDSPAALIPTGIAATTACEILVLCTTTDNRGGFPELENEPAGLMFDSTLLNGYASGYNSNSGGSNHVITRVDPAPTSLAVFSLPRENNIPYWTRFSVTGGELKAKFWLEGDNEPTTWTLETTDSTYTSGVPALLRSFNLGLTQFLYVGIGTDGDLAPVEPVTPKQYFTDFSEYTTGIKPSDWTLRWAALDNWAVQDDVSATGGKILRHTGSVASRNLLSWDEVPVDAESIDVEILTKIKFIGTLSGKQTIVASRASGAAGNETGYRGTLGPYDNRTDIARYVNGGASFLAVQSGQTYALDVWYLFKFRTVGSTLQLKYWQEGTGEPATWTQSITNTEIATAGWVGIFAFLSGDYEVDFFSVGTGGYPAPTESVEQQQFYTDFSEYTTGVPPSDWTLNFGVGANDYTVEALGGATGGKILKYNAPGGFSGSALIWDAVGQHYNCEVLVLARCSASSSSASDYAITRYSPTFDSELGFRQRADAAQVVDDDAILASVNNGSDEINFRWYRFRVEGSNVKAKTWDFGAAEPAWDVDITPTLVSNSVGGIGTGVNIQQYFIDIDIFSVGVDGAAASMVPIGSPETPINLSAEQITATSALLTWSPGP